MTGRSRRQDCGFADDDRVLRSLETIWGLGIFWHLTEGVKVARIQTWGGLWNNALNNYMKRKYGKKKNKPMMYVWAGWAVMGSFWRQLVEKESFWCDETLPPTGYNSPLHSLLWAWNPRCCVQLWLMWKSALWRRFILPFLFEAIMSSKLLSPHSTVLKWWGTQWRGWSRWLR